jgi:predicted phage terminase large subunit-like protein
MSSRLNDMATGRTVIIMQRLHEDDPSGFVLAGGGWEHLCLPSEYEPDRASVTYVGGREFWRDPRVEAGELLFAAKFAREVLEAAKAPSALGAYGYAGQHQQRPSPVGGGMFEASWWRFWHGRSSEQAKRPRGCYDGPAVELPPRFDQIVISVDANFRAKETADPVSIGVLGGHGADRYLLERQSGPYGFARTIEVLRDVYARWRARGVRKVAIEARANGDAIIETLRREIPGVVGVEPEGGKEARAWAIQPQVQAGNVYLPDGAPWLDSWVEQFGSFPKSRHDDDVDMLSQGLRELTQTAGVLASIARAG